MLQEVSGTTMNTINFPIPSRQQLCEIAGNQSIMCYPSTEITIATDSKGAVGVEDGHDGSYCE